MAQGKDPKTADGLGGVHNAVVPRQPVPAVPPDPEPAVVAEGVRAGYSRLVDDPEQIARAVHTLEAPIAPDPSLDGEPTGTAARTARTSRAPYQDAQISPDDASVWTAAKTPAGR
jgi:hypothetical protein